MKKQLSIKQRELRLAGTHVYHKQVNRGNFTKGIWRNTFKRFKTIYYKTITYVTDCSLIRLRNEKLYSLKNFKFVTKYISRHKYFQVITFKRYTVYMYKLKELVSTRRFQKESKKLIPFYVL